MLVRLISLTIVTVESKFSTRLFMRRFFAKAAFNKKALFMSAFFVFAAVSTLYPQYAIADICSPSRLSPPEVATVKWVYDGDTVLLNDKRKIRLIGIDTPEVKHHKQKQQAYAAKAKEALRELLKKSNYKINLRYGVERKDRYSRTLAHIFTPSGINIESWLLEKGFATTLVFPPNVELADCYKKSEKLAQQQALGIWQLNDHELKDAASLSRKVKGRVRLKGKVKKVIRHKKSIIMELDSNSKSHIQIKLQKKYFHYFKNFDTDKLWDKTIIISGFLKNKRNKRTISLKHPSQISVVSHKTVKPTIIWSSQNAD